MNPKTILTEDGWEDAAPDCKGKDKEFTKALGAYASCEDEEFDEGCKALAKITALAGTLKGANEVKGDKDAVKYLTDVINAAKTKQAELTKAKAQAKKQADDAAKKKEKEDQDDEESGDSVAKLTTGLRTLKTSQKPYYFLACDAKPYGFVLSKKDIRKNTQARKELAQVAGGSTRPPKVGECHFDGGKLILDMDRPPSGLARILQKWIKDSTGMTLKVMIGTESSDDDENPN